MGWQDDPVLSAPAPSAPSQQQPTAPAKAGWESDPVLDTGTQTEKDASKIQQENGFFPEPVRAATIAAANSALFNAETHAAALKDKLETGKSYEQAFKDRKEYEDALARRNPNATLAGNVVGIGGSMLLPLGPLGKVATVSADAAKAMGAGKLLQSAASGFGLGSTFGGISALTENPYSPTLASDIQSSMLTSGALGSVVGPAAERVLSRFAEAPNVYTTDKNGTKVLTDKALDAVRKALPTLNDADIKAIEPTLVSTMTDKGINGPAIQEALMQSVTNNSDMAMPLSKALVTGTKLPGEAGKVAAEAKSGAAQNAVEIAKQMAGPESARTSGAKAYQAAERSAFEDVQNLYDQGKNVEGVFGNKMAPAKDVSGNIPKSFADRMVEPVAWQNVIQDNVTQALQDNKTIQGINIFKYPGLDSAKQANQILDKVFSTPNPSFQELMYAKKLMNDLQYKATGEDKAATGAIINGYKSGIQKLLQDGHFSGDADKALHVFNNADAEWNNFQKTFHPDQGQSATRMAQLTKSLSEGTPYVSKTLTPGMENAGQEIINTAIAEPKVGQHFYETISKALGPNSQGMQDFNASIVNNIFKSVTNPNVPPNTFQLAKDINLHLRPETMPITLGAFGAKAGDPASMAAAQQKVGELRRFAQALQIINKTTNTQSEAVSQIGNAIKSLSLTGIGSILGIPAGIGPLGGGIAGLGISAAERAARLRSQIAAERAGAPSTKAGEFAGQGMKLPFGTIYPGIRTIPSTTDQNQQKQQSILPVARARGGRINGPMTAQQLLGRMKEVGKKDENSTKPLLKLHDTTVANALAIANKHI